MSVKKWTETQAPRVGKRGKYESIYSVELPRVNICFTDEQTGEEAEAIRAMLSRVKSRETLAKENIDAMVTLATNYLAARDLPNEHRDVTVYDDGSWHYGASDRIPQKYCGWELSDALKALGEEPRTATWHAARVITYGNLVLGSANKSAETKDTGTWWYALHAAMTTVEAFDAARLQASGFEAHGLTNLHNAKNLNQSEPDEDARRNAYNAARFDANEKIVRSKKAAKSIAAEHCGCSSRTIERAFTAYGYKELP